MITRLYKDKKVYQAEADDNLTECEPGSYAMFAEEEGWWAVLIDDEGGVALHTDPLESAQDALDTILSA